MTNINWDLAPEGAIAVGQRFGELAFMNAEGLVYIGGDWVVSSGWNIIGKRPQPEQARKTVEDAVNDCVCVKVKLEQEWDCILHSGEDYYFVGSDYAAGWEHELICTREEFEACVAAKAAQSEWKELSVYGKPKSTGDKSEWTHVTNSGCNCKVIVRDPDVKGVIIVLAENGEYMRHTAEALKPIKPTITKAEAWDKLHSLERSGLGYAYLTVTGKYDITD